MCMAIKQRARAKIPENGRAGPDITRRCWEEIQAQRTRYIIWGLTVTISVWRMTAYDMVELTDESVSHGALWKGLEDLFL